VPLQFEPLIIIGGMVPSLRSRYLNEKGNSRPTLIKIGAGFIAGQQQERHSTGTIERNSDIRNLNRQDIPTTQKHRPKSKVFFAIVQSAAKPKEKQVQSRGPLSPLLLCLCFHLSHS